MSNKFIRRIAAYVFTICVAGMALGGTFTLKDGMSDWTLASSYDEAAVPSASDDVIQIPEDATVYLDLTTAEGLASLAIANTVYRIVPLSPTSVLDVTVGADQDVQTLNRPFTYSHINRDSTHMWYGELIKRGAGELVLDNGNGETDSRAFLTKLTVKEGTLTLPQQWPTLLYITKLTIDQGATLVTGHHTSRNVWTVYYYLEGGGTVTNRSESSSHRFECFGGSASSYSTFSGKITGNAAIYNAGYVDFTGSESDTIWDMVLDYQRTRVTHFANRGASSSIGAGTWINVYEKGGTLGYIGEGNESSDRYFGVAVTNGAFTLDAGPAGGVDFTGAWKWWNTADSKTWPYLRIVFLEGDNANECVISGPISDFVSEDSTATPITGYFVKRGSGTWRFAESAGRANAGGFWIQNGTLRYDSLEEAGRICALGTATNRTYAMSQDLSKLANHPLHEFVVGNNATTGVMEYTGTNGYFCGTRLLLVNTNAVFRTNAQKPIRFGQVANFTTKPAALTLDGTSTCTNEMLDVSDGASTRGPLSVIKDGTGTWRLGGYQTFSGALTVKQGKLIVKQTEPGPYTWYRFTVTDTCRPKGTYGYSSTTIGRLALFSETNSAGKGTAQVGWKSMTYATNYVDILPGQVSIQDNMPVDFTRYTSNYVVSNNTPEQMFNPSSTGGYGMFLRLAWGSAPNVQLADAATHIPIIMRLPEGSPEIIAFDYVSTFGSSSTAGICGYKFEGSVDGMHWETVAETNDAPLNSASYYWVYGKNQYPRNESEGSCPLTSTRSTATYSVLNNVSDVTVLGGATMEAEGDVTLSTLTVDATDAGTVEGFTFPETGTLKVINLPGESGVLPITVTSDTASNLEKWTLNVNGSANTKLRVKVDSSGHLSLFPVGTLLIFR